uniref:N-6 adenine-specific DNA methyltransferase 1 n=1 Tax=Tetraodon nigroviridis TaxID=99883 RepID=Q800G0_TETNG|nr:putative methylase [Tetraodon nigroviridis]
MSTSYPTPVYSHVGRGDFTDVYEPAEDTFLLMDALEKDAETLQRSSCVSGSGQWFRSGVCISGISDRTFSFISCTDLNPAAAQCTAKTSSCNRVSLQPVITSLVGSRGIEAAWAGGRRGREVTDRFLPVVAQLLSTEGSFYLITIAENDPEDIITALSLQGLQGESFLSRRAGNERLSVLRFQRS